MSKDLLQPDFDTVGAMVISHGENHGHLNAMTYAGRTITYKDVDERSARAAAYLHSLGLKKGDRLVHLGKASFAVFDIYFAAARIGVSFVSLNFRLSPPEIAYQIDDCGATHVFFDSVFEELLSDIPAGTITRHQMDTPDFEEEVLSHAPYTSLDAEPDTELMMMYTSGTTGRAKGVMVSQYSYMVSRGADGHMGDWSIYTPGDPLMVATPLFHIAGVGWALIGFYNLQHLILEPDFIPDTIIKSLIDNKIQRVLFVPVMLVFLLQALKDSDLTFPDLKIIAYGASPINADLLKASIDRFGCGFVQVYGMTETNGAACYMPPEDHEDPGQPRFRSAGKPYPFLEITIRDEKGQILPPGETGEVWVKTPSIMTGYLNRPEATKEVMEDGWYKSGDGGYMDADGYVYIRDRIKDMIISGGENIYPTEVEQAAMATGLFSECSIFGVPDEIWGEMVVIAGVSKTSLDIDGVREKLKGTVADYKMPRRLMMMDQLPRNSSGKVLRTVLREMAQAESG